MSAWRLLFANLKFRYREWRDGDGPDLVERMRRIWQRTERTGA